MVRLPLILLIAALIFAVSSTILLGVHLFAPPHIPNNTSISGTPSSNATSSGSSSFISGIEYSGIPPQKSPFLTILGLSPFLSTAGWAFVGIVGVWIWRGSTKSRWEKLGFDSKIFDLFTRMKGAKTRLSLLDALALPKDRLQLAKELEIDWKAVDYQINLLSKYGLVHERAAFGKVRMYQLTTLGEVLLKLLKEFNAEIDPTLKFEREQSVTRSARTGDGL